MRGRNHLLLYSISYGFSFTIIKWLQQMTIADFSLPTCLPKIPFHLPPSPLCLKSCTSLTQQNQYCSSSNMVTVTVHDTFVVGRGTPLPGPEVGLLSNTRKRIVRGDTCWQSKRFYWERAPGWRAVGKGTQENCPAAWLAVLGFMVMGLVSGWSLANHSNSESFLVAHASLSQDGC